MSVTIKLKSETVRRARKDKEFSQAYMAYVLDDISQSYYSKIERGLCNITTKQIKIITEQLELQIFDILDFGELQDMVDA